MDSNIYDLCIVGAGMFGSAAARHASSIAGIKVCLIGTDEPTSEETQTREIFASHYDESRITRTLDFDVPSQVLSKHSIKRYRELEELSGVQFYEPVGFLWISKKGNAITTRMKQASEISNLPVVDLSYSDIFKKRYPYFKLTEGHTMLFDDFGGGYISPRKMVAAQRKVAKQQGCEIIHKIVEEVKPLAEGTHEIIAKDGEVIKARRVLICTGAYTNFKKFPIPKLKVFLNKETLVFLKLSVEEAERLSAMPTFLYVDPEGKLGPYAFPPIQYPDGNYYLKIGDIDFDRDDQAKSLKEIRQWYLSKGDPKKLEPSTKLVIDMIPGLLYQDISYKACVTCSSSSEQPYIDRVLPTVTVAVVGNGKAAKFSDEIGRIAAILSVTGRWDSELPKSTFKIVVDDDNVE